MAALPDESGADHDDRIQYAAFLFGEQALLDASLPVDRSARSTTVPHCEPAQEWPRRWQQSPLLLHHAPKRDRVVNSSG
jgi:hypothetical protein